MGEAKIDIKPYIDAIEMRLENLLIPTMVARVQPSKGNCLVDESSIVWKDSKIYQDMALRLSNVESGEVEIQLGVDRPRRRLSTPVSFSRDCW
ncbi:hypothetical protein NL676_037948 [Syzygium grande]|nr:hypothetical protein NL676_037948 [Syzygium grande]